jgi:hypothetical protein
MKNFGFILTFFAVSASSVTALAIPESQSAIEARSPYPALSTLQDRSPKKNKEEGAAVSPPKKDGHDRSSRSYFLLRSRLLTLMQAKNATAVADSQAAQVRETDLMSKHVFWRRISANKIIKASAGASLSAATNGTAAADDKKAAKKAAKEAAKAAKAAKADPAAQADSADAGNQGGNNGAASEITGLLSSLGINLRDVEKRFPKNEKAAAAGEAKAAGAKAAGAKAVRIQLFI